MNLLKGPSPRFGAQMAIKQGILYLFGGLVEDSNDRQFTHKDLYALGDDFFSILSKINTGPVIQAQRPLKMFLRVVTSVS